MPNLKDWCLRGALGRGEKSKGCAHVHYVLYFMYLIHLKDIMYFMYKKEGWQYDTPFSQ